MNDIGGYSAHVAAVTDPAARMLHHIHFFPAISNTYGS